MGIRPTPPETDMRKTVLTLMLAASAITSAASNTQTAPMASTRQGTDGIATRAEAIAQADARFAQMDTDHDGRVTGGEMRAYRAALHDRMVASGRDGPVPLPGRRKHDGMGRRMASNGDGSVTREAFTARALKRFDRMDANHDGTIDATERANAAEMRHVDRRGRRDGVTAPVTMPAPTPAR
jgi:ribosomal protein S10